MIDVVRSAIEQGQVGERLWMYSNYHCNLACVYCLTESAPGVDRRALAPDVMIEIATEAVELGFLALGVTGGEPFLVPEMSELAAELGRILPLVILTNGTLFAGARLERIRKLGGTDVRLQISLDRSEPVANDEMRGFENFKKVVEAVPRLIDMGVGVRIATTLAFTDPDDLARLCELHRSLGVDDKDHVVRGVVRRGRALSEGLGEPVGIEQLSPELTITDDGAFWSPFGPTVVGGRLDTDLMVTRGTRPLRRAAEALVGLVTDSVYAGSTDDRFT